MYVADAERKPTADDFAQTAVVPRSPNAQQTAVIEECVFSPRLIKRIDAVYSDAILKHFFADDALRTVYRERAASLKHAGGTSIGILAAIRLSITGVRPRVQEQILDTVAVKPFLASSLPEARALASADARLQPHGRVARAHSH